VALPLWIVAGAAEPPLWVFPGVAFSGDRDLVLGVGRPGSVARRQRTRAVLFFARVRVLPEGRGAGPPGGRAIERVQRFAGRVSARLAARAQRAPARLK